MKMDIEEVIKFIKSTSKETKIYVGCDSVIKHKGTDAQARYGTVVVVHMDGNHGCKVFGNISTERDFGSLRHRLLTEVGKCAELVLQLLDHIGDHELEVHLDINTDPRHASNAVIKEAAGYMMGMTGINPHFKPNAPVASICADNLIH